MAFTKLTNSLNTVEQLPDTPNRTSGYTAAQMKAFFDENAQLIKAFINDTLISELEGNGAASGNSGAKNVGVASREEFSDKTNVEDVLIYYRDLIRQAVAGKIGDNDIKTKMLNHTAGYEAVDTDAVQDNAITNDKLAGGITSDKIVSVLASVISGLITNEQLAGGITYDKLAGSIRSSQLYGAIEGSKLLDNSIESVKLANGIDGAKLSDKTVSTEKIADSAVTTAKVLDGAITNAKLAGSIEADKLSGGIGTDKLSDSAITTAKINDSAVTTTKINNGAVTNDKVASGINVNKLTGVLSTDHGGTGRSAISTVKFDVTFKDNTTASYVLLTEPY